MKRVSRIFVGLVFVAVSAFQFRLIAASLASLAAWCVLTASDPESFKRYWVPGLCEYWLAAGAWGTVAVLLLRSVLRLGKKEETRNLVVATGFNRTERWSRRVLWCITCVALTSPFLTPMDPNVQGNLVTTRLKPPFSLGYVREYLSQSSTDPMSTHWLHQAFNQAGDFVLNRRMAVSGNPDMLLPESQHEGRIVREFPAVFLFGTDDNARDVFSRVIAGARISLGVGISAALGALLIGAAIGFSAGVSRGFAGSVLMRLTDLFLAIPSLFLVIGALAFVGQSVSTIILVLSLTGWMGIARVVRGEVVSLREREFIIAAKLLRVSNWNVLVRHLLPNLRPVLVTAAVLQFANAVLGEAALGFLGLGVQPPTATWGNMMGEATGYLGSAWWVGVFPGILLATVIVSAHSMSERSTTMSDVNRTVMQSEPP